MPSSENSPAPATAPAIRAESAVARDRPMALVRQSLGMVSPISELRITRSDGRTIPDSADSAKT